MVEKKTTGKNTDIQNLKARVEALKKHLSKNKHDYRTKRTLQIKQAKLRKLLNYKKGKEKKSE